MSSNVMSSMKGNTEFVEVLDPNESVEDVLAEEVGVMAKEFPFKLDSFQMQAILHLERHSNVLVSAHTSAGKTVVADYAIAMAFRSSSRVVYTSPIKALSNQKYRDFRQEFSDVGLLTGDVQINSEAKCLIMTTEILLQMLYNKNELINDLEWVVFDECHYINDPERGHVWEEVFILLPKKCNLVLLSATVPNVVQFADWLGRTRQKKTYVVFTSKRPVPLQHYLYIGRDAKTKNHRFKVVDSDNKFLIDNYKEVETLWKERKPMNRCPNTERNIYLTLIRHLAEKDKLPAIFFTLSRRRCDENLQNLMSISADSFQLTTKVEESRIHRFVWRHIRKLKECDQKLPQVLRSVEMLKRGLGVHHSGILPILKEITEILFSEGLVKVLVATETFAMGVNMPARTVVFDSIEKHDGKNLRDLKPSEYIQMAGRAGRRGKDKTGTVIILCKYKIPDPIRLCAVMQGSPTKLESQFRLTYHMICNFHKTSKTEENNFEYFMERSFGEHYRFKKNSMLTKQLDALNISIDGLPQPTHVCDDCSDIESFYECLEEYIRYSSIVRPWLGHKQVRVGRIVVFVGQDNPFQYGLILRVNKENLTILSLKPNNSDFEYQSIGFELIHTILNQELKPKTFNSVLISAEIEKKNRVKEETMNTIERLKELNLENNYKLMENESFDRKVSKTLDLIDYYDKYIVFGQKLLSFNCIKCKQFLISFDEIKGRVSLNQEKRDLEYSLSGQSLRFRSEYDHRISVLLEMEYLNPDLILELKGRMTCLMAEHELIITEMLMNNIIGDLTPQQIAALLSCFVCQQKTEEMIDESGWDPILIKKREDVLGIIGYISSIERKCGVQASQDMDTLRFDVVHAVHEWANGKPFVNVIELSEVQEGIIVRYIQRLDELLKFVTIAAKLMGNHELEEKIGLASQSIRRDIVFCPSLYTTMDSEANVDEADDSVDENQSSNFI